jgi:CBS domain-containing protein
MTEFDLVEAIQEDKELNKTTAEEIMTKEVVTADVDTPVSERIKIMTGRCLERHSH